MTKKSMEETTAKLKKLKAQKSKIVLQENELKAQLMEHLVKKKVDSVQLKDCIIKKKASGYSLKVTAQGLVKAHATAKLVEILNKRKLTTYLTFGVSKAMLFKAQKESDKKICPILKNAGLTIEQGSSIEIKY